MIRRIVPIYSLLFPLLFFHDCRRFLLLLPPSMPSTDFSFIRNHLAISYYYYLFSQSSIPERSSHDLYPIFYTWRCCFLVHGRKEEPNFVTVTGISLFLQCHDAFIKRLLRLKSRLLIIRQLQDISVHDCVVGRSNKRSFKGPV